MTPKPLALTMGEPAGISSEITLKAWTALAGNSARSVDNKLAQGASAPASFSDVTPFFVIDDPVRLARAAQDLGLDVPISPITHPAKTAGIFGKALPVLPLESAALASLNSVRMGTPDAVTAEAVIASIATGVDLCRNGEAAGLVTNPIQKEPLIQAGFAHIGHTEYLGALLAEMPLPGGRKRGPVMMLAAGDFKVVPLTTHIPISQVPKHLTVDGIIRTVRIVAQALIRDFGISDPRLALCGLNPHAGEGGMIGDEETRIISPAIKMLRESGIEAIGPIAADSLFHETARKAYDATIAMYHDQALIPIKTVHFFSAVNITLGLPIIRSSPDHGTGLGLVGKGVARPDSLINALGAAMQIAKARQQYDAAS